MRTSYSSAMWYSLLMVAALLLSCRGQEYDFAAEMTRQCLVPDPYGLLDCVENKVTLPYLTSWVDCTNSLGENVATLEDIINYRCKSVWEGKGLIPEVFFIKDCVIEKTGLPAKNVSAEVLGAYKECESNPAGASQSNTQQQLQGKKNPAPMQKQTTPSVQKQVTPPVQSSVQYQTSQAGSLPQQSSHQKSPTPNRSHQSPGHSHQSPGHSHQSPGHSHQYPEHSHQLPVQYPIQQSPIHYQSQQSPILYQSQQSPIQYQSQQSPIQYQTQQSPIQYQTQQSPNLYQSQQSPAQYPVQQSPIQHQSQHLPTQYPIQQSPIQYQIQRSPIQHPIQQSPIQFQIAQSPMLQQSHQSQGQQVQQSPNQYPSLQYPMQFYARPPQSQQFFAMYPAQQPAHYYAFSIQHPQRKTVQ